ncbi:TaqI-like C-terminal specificity domain-containing protein [Psychrobacter sp. Ps3]|uniref:Eco57I restriction-modification methylase domain-containing protein n=1 Tax=Psychrobacter sp. Ps3 TaxID=2790957 RepID=UPI001EDD4742|nr:TaqI-like C-terminal specificity domain-containing protein [Psychrobacter sp. Ps3]MCG3882765.1 N-6 DNA methylase [Psychrobacter sp. Ps3]
MSLFQSIVIEKYVRELDQTELNSAWQAYSDYFLDLGIQDNIRISKEEQYQEGFLRDLFVKVLGYTLNPNADYDLTTEFKNQTGSKKADGAILKEGYAIGVIELKGMNTTDLSKIEPQAFGYKNNQPKCRYVITSNFQKLRLYIDNAVEFIEFNLFTLSQADFAQLYLLLHQSSIMSDLPAKIKSASLSQEEAITKQLYKDYSVFKRELFNDLTTRNPSIDNLVLFQKSQKLLDRLLFIFFAEDSHLLPANFAKGIISEWEQLKSLKMTVPLYDRIKAYFGYLDQGHKDEHSEIFAYNGGLFSPDALLDSVIISDDILQTHIKILSEYDFDSEVDVNILGHIFENSLTELDEVKAQLAGEAVDKSQTKRKKDGVFYTPKYITKYIVENTVGKLCADKKSELAINDEDYQQDVTINKDGTKKKKSAKKIAAETAALERLHSYRDWLLQITICDPACGSGAFLNEALNFLIAEHEYIVELETKLFGSGLPYADIENSILENNLFGVDINEESVEIAKLSLWLRTAQPRRKLNNLNDNIQCGNSLIDDVDVAGDKAFNWQTAFPQVFAKGGFDVVIGNPPYVRPRFQSEKEVSWLLNRFESAENQFDLYHLFIEKAEKIRNSKGVVSFILPNAFLANKNSVKLRKFLLDNVHFTKIIECGDSVFSDASVDVLIYVSDTSKEISKFYRLADREIVFRNLFDQNSFYENEGYNFTVTLSPEQLDIFQKIRDNSKELKDFVDVMGGIKEYQVGKGKPPQDISMKNNRVFNSTEKKDATFVKEVRGKHVFPFILKWENEYVSYGPWLAEPRNPKFFIGPRIFVRQIPGKERLYCAYTEDDYIVDQSAYIIKPKSENLENFRSLEGILNSNLIFWYYRNQNNEFDTLFPKIKSGEIKVLPISSENLDKNLAQKADLMLSLNEQLQDTTGKFIRILQRKFEIEKLSKKLENWHELTYAEFIKELAKKKVKMSLSEEAEWEEYFLAEQAKAQQLMLQIENTDKEIDQMVYKLYDLTDDEIAIIEAS